MVPLGPGLVGLCINLALVQYVIWSGWVWRPPHKSTRMPGIRGPSPHCGPACVLETQVHLGTCLFADSLLTEYFRFGMHYSYLIQKGQLSLTHLLKSARTAH